MATIPEQQRPKPDRAAGPWAGKVARLSVGHLPAGAVNLNVDGRRLTSPVQGFGQLWQKTYSIRMEGTDASPEDVVAAWKANFAEFWPRNAHWYGSLDGVSPGDVAVLNVAVGPFKIATGVLVLYVDDTSFTVMTPEGHNFAGFNTFSARSDPDGVTVAEIVALFRSNDPIWEIGLLLRILHVMEDRQWGKTLRNLAAHFGVEEATVSKRGVCLDRRRQWQRWRNVWHNALIRSALHAAATPVRALPRKRRGGPTDTDTLG